jgi:hypothetical protein
MASQTQKTNTNFKSIHVMAWDPRSSVAHSYQKECGSNVAPNRTIWTFQETEILVWAVCKSWYLQNYWEYFDKINTYRKLFPWRSSICYLFLKVTKLSLIYEGLIMRFCKNQVLNILFVSFPFTSGYLSKYLNSENDPVGNLLINI